MALKMPGLSAFFNPPLCANNHAIIDGNTTQCEKTAPNACSRCRLVQYCSKECQIADWSHHKATCKSPFLKETWKPNWFVEKRKPDWISDNENQFMSPFGAPRYLWGNVAALDVLRINDNEGVQDVDRNFNLLFAASGDMRNLVKTIVGIPDKHKGKCVAVMNDKDIITVARNVIKLLVALVFEAETAVPIIIHLWYSALLPRAMLEALQSTILPMIEDVCEKIKHKDSDDTLQAKTFKIKDRSLRVVLKKEEWTELAKCLQVPSGLTFEQASDMRRGVTLAPGRVDYHDRARLEWSPAVRQGEMHFRSTGILLPYGCSLDAYDTPNPTFYPGNTWPMSDSATPKDGWSRSDIIESAGCAKEDEHGALFFYLRKLLLEFCVRVQEFDVTFETYCMDARKPENFVGNTKFDRIEISNISDTCYLGPKVCLKAFSKLLRPKSENSKATLLMSFQNAVVSVEKEVQKTHMQAYLASMKEASSRLEKYMSIQQYPSAGNGETSCPDPREMRYYERVGRLLNREPFFDRFMANQLLMASTSKYGLKVKKTHTIVEPWPFKIGTHTTQAEFEMMCASGFSSCVRYMEFGKLG
ncbi:hypothetical protein BKA63DRAFT_575003 [Paraphoma chrysanthemicola]|nr:hypothetical protein BKA63DRAFT_575003 [Paraphoma chrysanthemicola]